MPRITMDTPLKKIVPCVLTKSMAVAMASPHRNLVTDDPLLESTEPRRRRRVPQGKSAGRPSKVRTPASQDLTMVGFAFSHSSAAICGCS